MNAKYPTPELQATFQFYAVYSSARSKALNSLRKKGPVKQDDPSILDYMYDNCDVLLRPPDGKPTNYKGPNPSMGQAEVVFRILNNMVRIYYVHNYVRCGPGLLDAYKRK